jgi:predicted nucleotidyltransferase component of viral defense system
MFHLSTVEPGTYQTLKAVFAIPSLQKNFALAGGTSLSLQLGHRKSIDLDIFTSQAFDVRQVELLLSAEPGLKFEFTNSNSNMLFSFINAVKCDFVFEPHRLINPYLEHDGVNYFSVPDIAAMKMHTICGRGKRKDFFDLYVLIENFGWNQLLDWFKSKYNENQLYFLWRSICYFDDADEDVAIKGLTPYTKTWEEIKEYITEKCK